MLATATGGFDQALALICCGFVSQRAPATTRALVTTFTGSVALGLLLGAVTRFSLSWVGPAAALAVGSLTIAGSRAPGVLKGVVINVFGFCFGLMQIGHLSGPEHPGTGPAGVLSMTIALVGAYAAGAFAGWVNTDARTSLAPVLLGAILLVLAACALLDPWLPETLGRQLSPLGPLRTAP